MASKHQGRKGRKMGKYLRGSIDENLSLGTLGSKVLIADTWDEVVVERTLISSIVATWSLDQLTAPQGPIVFGVAHSDYSDAEIEAVIENAGSWNEGNKTSQEISKRLVRVIGTMAATLGSGAQDLDFADGKTVKTKLNWILTTGDTLKMWAYNVSNNPLATTDPTLRANGHANLWAK